MTRSKSRFVRAPDFDEAGVEQRRAGDGRGEWSTSICITVVLGAYFSAAVSARAIALSGGLAAAISPAAGVALAAMLGWGARCWPAVWLGAFLVEFVFDRSPAGLGVAALAATGATLQALAGFALTRRFLRTPLFLSREPELARFLVLAGPVASVIGATFGIAALATFNRLPGGAAASEWVMRWGGDALGVLLVAPLILLAWPAQSRRLWRTRSERVRLSLLLLGAALLLAAGRYSVERFEDGRARLEATHGMGQLVERHFAPLPELLVPLKDVERFIAAASAITAGEFTSYTSWAARDPALLSIEWAPRVPAAERAAFERSAAPVHAGFRIVESGRDGQPIPATQRAQYFPVLYANSAWPEFDAPGLDHGADVAKRMEMERARATGAPLATAPEPLADGRRAMRVFQPVYEPVGDDGRTEPAAEREVVGYVVGLYDLDALIVSFASAARANAFVFRLWDASGGAARVHLYGEIPAGVAPALIRTVEFAGRTLLLEVALPPYWGSGKTSREERIYIGFSVLAALLAAFLALSTASHAAAVELEVAQRTSDLQRELAARRGAEDQLDRFFNLSLDMFCIAGTDGYFRRVNPAFERALGWCAAELLERPYCDFIHPDDVAPTHDKIGRVGHGEITVGFANRYRCKDGSWRWLEWNVLSQPGGLMFATATDCTHRHETAARAKQLNADLECRVVERGVALEAVAAKEQELRAVVDNLLECVITIDSCGIVQRANPAVERVLGYGPDEVQGRNVSMLMPEPHRTQHDGYLERYLEDRDGRVVGTTREVEGRHKDGQTIPLELSISEYRVGNERFFVGTLRDIGERKALIAALMQAREDAEQASRAKSAFLATMSHEIRTPMNGVVGLVDVLDHTPLSVHQSDLVRTIRESSATLLGIIDDILDFSKIEAGRLELELEPVSVPAIVEGLCASLVPVATLAGVRLSLFVAPDVPASVLGDELRLRQVLYNLAGNAIKFSGGRGHEGRVSVRVAMLPGLEPRLALSVEDNGIGVAPGRLAQLFDAFTQAETSTTRRFGGTGLGLAISRRLVAMMGGEIDARSAPGAGSVFTVTLPVTVVVPATSPGSDLRGLACAIVESVDYDAADLRAYLLHAGASVEVVADAGDAFAREPAVIVMSGADADRCAPSCIAPKVRVERGRRRAARVVAQGVVAVDGDALSRCELERAVALAAHRVLPGASGDGGATADRDVPALPPSIEEARSNGRLILVAEDDATNQKVILQQLGLLGWAAEVAGDGAEALRLWRTGDYALLLTDLHMPEVDGYMLARAIRDEEHAFGEARARIPILALTANALRGESIRAREAGMDEYLTKPLPLEALKAAIERWLPTVEGIKAAQSPEDEGLSTRARVLLDLGVLEALVGGDRALVGGILADFVVSARALGTELDEAWARSDGRAAGAVAHKLKSAARTIGAGPLSELCAELENGGRAEDCSALARLIVRFRQLLDAVVAEVEAQVPLAAPGRGETRCAYL